MRKIIAAKLHGITVTGADLHYHGSVTLDPEQCNLAGILPLEFVDIWNKNSGARISTYVIFGEAGSRCCVLNGAAARTCQVGDEVIVVSHRYIQENELTDARPRVLTFTDDNRVDQVLEYAVEGDPDAGFSFAVRER
jgi:aspartate 1-decarboxylase